MTRIILHAAGRAITVHPHNRSSAGLNVFLHRATFGDSAGALIGGGHHPEGVHARRTPIQDANQAYDIKIRHMSTGSDSNVRLFAASQSDAEERAKARAMREYKISPDKLRDLEGRGISVFRVVSSVVSPDQSKYVG